LAASAAAAIILLGVIMSGGFSSDTAGAQGAGDKNANGDKSSQGDKPAEPKPYTPRALGDKWIDRATNAWSAGDYPEAIYWYRKWLEAAPRDNHAWYNLACTYAISGQADKAIDAFEAAVDAGWDDADAATNDPDFKTIRDADPHAPRFKAACERIRVAADAKRVPGQIRRCIPLVTMGTYVAYLPEGFDAMDAKAKAALKICLILHGHGSTETNHGDSLSGILGRDGVVYLAPRAPHINLEDSLRTQRAGFTVYHNVSPSEYTQEVHPFVQYADFIEDCVGDARKALGLSATTKLHVLGHSMGGAAAFVFSARYPELVSTCFIHAGFVPEMRYGDYPEPTATGPRADGGGGLAKAKSGGVTYTISHCKSDPIVPLKDGEGIVAKLKAAGIDAKTQWWDSNLHGFPPEARESAKAWLRGQ